MPKPDSSGGLVKKAPTSPGREKDGGKESNFQIWYVAVAAMFRVIIRRRNDGRRRMRPQTAQSDVLPRPKDVYYKTRGQPRGRCFYDDQGIVTTVRE